MCSIHQAQQWDLPESKLGGLEHNRQTDVSRAQTNRDRASRATTNLTTQLHLTCGTNREKNEGRVADGFRQRAEQPQQTWGARQT